MEHKTYFLAINRFYRTHTHPTSVALKINSPNIEGFTKSIYYELFLTINTVWTPGNAKENSVGYYNAETESICVCT